MKELVEEEEKIRSYRGRKLPSDLLSGEMALRQTLATLLNRDQRSYAARNRRVRIIRVMGLVRRSGHSSRDHDSTQWTA